MRNLAGKIKLIVTLAIVVALVVIGVLNLRDRLRAKPLPTDGVQWHDTAHGIEAKSLIDSDPPSPLRLWLKPGDVVEYVFFSGKYERVTHAETISRYLDKLGVGGQARYVIRHQDEPLRLIYGASEPLYDYSFEVQAAPKDLGLGLYLAVVGLVYLLIGLFVLFKQSRAELTYHFFAWFLASFVLYFYDSIKTLRGLDRYVYFLDGAALSLLPPLFLHFCMRFPSRINLKGKTRLIAALLYAPAAVLVVMEALYAYAPSLLPAGRLVSVRFALNLAELVQLALYFLIGSCLLVVSFVQAKTPILRQQLKWIIWGLGLSELPFVLLYVLPFVSNVEVPAVMKSAAYGPLILVPLSFGYSIIRYRLMDVDVIVRRSFVHMLAIIAIGAIYMAMLLAVGDVVKFIWAPADLNSWSTRAVVVVGMLIVAYLFTPIKNQLQFWGDRWFYGERYTLRTGLQDFGRMLAQTTALPSLLDSIARRLSQVFSVRGVAIFVEDLEQPSGFRLAHSVELDGGATLPDEIKEIIRIKSIGRGFISVEDIEAILGRGAGRVRSRAALAFSQRGTLPGTGPFSTVELLPKSGSLSEIQYPGSAAEVDEADNNPRDLTARAGASAYAPNGLYYYVPCVVRDRMVAVIGLGRTTTSALLTSEDTDLLRALSGYLAVAIDNSLLYRSEMEKAEELERLKDFSENIIESVSVGIIVVDLGGKITTWNSAMETMTGTLRESALGRGIQAALDPDLVETIRRVTGQDDWAISCVRQIYKYNLLAASGRQVTLNISVAPFEAARGVVAGTLLVMENVTERALLEQQLQQREKLSSIGLLAAGVAHEVNTPLAGISSYSQMLLLQVPEGDPKYQLLEKIQAQTMRASGIVSNLLNFSRTGDTQFREIDINKVLDDTLQLLDPQLRNTRIEVVRHYATQLPPGFGNGSRLQQVFMNLIMNARDAMAAGGRLTIRTRSAEGSLLIDFNDTGTGIAPENIARIYDPFFTTKEIGRGTGLGLALSYGIIQEHGGRIFVESRSGEGAHFTIKLPTAASRQMQVASD
jgi:two-component system NtrC family sensor kinase